MLRNMTTTEWLGQDREGQSENVAGMERTEPSLASWWFRNNFHAMDTIPTEKHMPQAHSLNSLSAEMPLLPAPPDRGAKPPNTLWPPFATTSALPGIVVFTFHSGHRRSRPTGQVTVLLCPAAPCNHWRDSPVPLRAL